MLIKGKVDVGTMLFWVYVAGVVGIIIGTFV